jgi:hypothetical protein
LLVSSQIVEVGQNPIENVFSAILRKAGYNLFQHVVALLVLGQEADIVILQKGLLDQRELFILGHSVYNILQSVGASIVARNLDKFVTFYLF